MGRCTNPILIKMGRVMTWHRDLSDRAAAEIVTATAHPELLSNLVNLLYRLAGRLAGEKRKGRLDHVGALNLLGFQSFGGRSPRRSDYS